MAYLVKCNRCGTTADVVFLNVDTGYWTQPPDWLVVEPSQVHLCPPCKARALENEEETSE
jgi:hypothetical protein